jgi:hypothetical protein
MMGHIHTRRFQPSQVLEFQTLLSVSGEHTACVAVRDVAGKAYIMKVTEDIKLEEPQLECSVQAAAMMVGALYAFCCDAVL